MKTALHQGRPPSPIANSFPTDASAECDGALRQADESLRCNLWRVELALIVGLLVSLNLPLLLGGNSSALAYHSASVRAGEWWRLITHPFVHVSWYHFALDAAAFFLAYMELASRRFRGRFSLVAASAAGGLAAAHFASPLVGTHGLCGLSGIAHGLTAIVALEMVRSSADKTVRLGGLACFLVVTGKCVLEACTGNVLFASWHPGSLGTPIAVCHAGGVLGALIAWLALRIHARAETPR